MHSEFVVEPHVTVKLLTIQIILSDVYQCFYGQFLSAAKIKLK